MAYDFLGTFNRSQFERLAAYAKGQLAHVEGRIKHLTYEQQRIGFLRFVFDSAGRPTAYSTGGSGSSPSYIGKLMAAYEAQGGDPFYDLQMRSKGDQSVFIPKGSETAATKVLSNGEPLPQRGLGDAPTANLVGSLKKWTQPALERRALLERKIRRAVDYVDQLQDEIRLLKIVTQTVETEGSLESLISEVNQHLADPNYRATGEDQGGDPFGKLSYAPLASYEPGKDRAPPDGLTVERTNQGYSVSGDGTSSS